MCILEDKERTAEFKKKKKKYDTNLFLSFFLFFFDRSTSDSGVYQPSRPHPQAIDIVIISTLLALDDTSELKQNVCSAVFNVRITFSRSNLRFSSVQFSPLTDWAVGGT